MPGEISISGVRGKATDANRFVPLEQIRISAANLASYRARKAHKARSFRRSPNRVEDWSFVRELLIKRDHVKG
jgi:hypothetical protein